MRFRKLFCRSSVVPYLLICGYGLFAVTTPPQTGEAVEQDLSAAAAPFDRTPLEVAGEPVAARETVEVVE